MAERYTRLYTLPENLYVSESPVLISAGALLKDNQSGRVLAQLKFRSISDRAISAIKILLVGYDVYNAEVCRTEHQYLDLNINRDNMWGAREAIPLPERSVRSFDVHVIAVFFADGSHYFAGEQNWLPLPVQQPLSNRLFDGELVRQYKLDTGRKSEYVPIDARDIWLCACGEVNHCGEACHVCGQELDTLMTLLNVELLREEKTERLRLEAERAAEAERFRAYNAKRLKLAVRIFVPIILAAAVLVFFYVRSDRRAGAYEEAYRLFNAGQYSEAAEAFDALGDYEDSAEMAAQAKASSVEISAYEKACKLLENSRYDDAYTVFLSLGDYKGSAELALETLYLKAQALTAEGKAEDAIAVYQSLGDYKDSAEAAEAFVCLVSREECSYDPECGGPLTTEYKYDSRGRISQKTVLYSAYPALTDRVYQYSYADDGSFTVTENQTVQHYDSHGSYIGQGDVVLYEYDYGYSSGGFFYCDRYSTEDGGFVCETIYDDHGNMMNFTDTDGSHENIINEYDEADNLIKQESYTDDGQALDRRSFEYGEDGLLKRMTFMDRDGSNSVTEYSYSLVYVPDLPDAE